MLIEARLSRVGAVSAGRDRELPLCAQVRLDAAVVVCDKATDILVLATHLALHLGFNILPKVNSSRKQRAAEAVQPLVEELKSAKRPLEAAGEIHVVGLFYIVFCFRRLIM
jgi:hypothetical protein